MYTDEGSAQSEKKLFTSHHESSASHRYSRFNAEGRHYSHENISNARQELRSYSRTEEIPNNSVQNTFLPLLESSAFPWHQRSDADSFPEDRSYFQENISSSNQWTLYRDKEREKPGNHSRSNPRRF